MSDFFKQSIEQSQKLLTAMQKDFNETVTFHNEMYTNLMKKLEERDKLIESLRAEIGKTKDKNKELEKNQCQCP
jgi:predicted translin family RNA/ssDNA-binding protein